MTLDDVVWVVAAAAGNAAGRHRLWGGALSRRAPIGDLCIIPFLPLAGGGAEGDCGGGGACSPPVIG